MEENMNMLGGEALPEQTEQTEQTEQPAQQAQDVALTPQEAQQPMPEDPASEPTPPRWRQLLAQPDVR